LQRNSDRISWTAYKIEHSIASYLHFIDSYELTSNVISNCPLPEESIDMNLAQSEVDAAMMAKTCGCKERGQRISYAYVHFYHSLCLDKKEILTAEIQACERLLRYVPNESERSVVEKEMGDLRMALDLLT
jgi:hypothetical protein